MLYPDPAGDIDRLLDEAAQGQPTGELTDEYGVRHAFFKIADAARCASATDGG